MGVRLLPMTLPELCLHALQLEQDLGARYGEYAQLMRGLGTRVVADAFEEMQRLKEQESRALEAGVHGHKLPELSPWEYVWRLTYASDTIDSGKRVAPRNACEALQLALAAERRSENFYSDTAENARDLVVRARAGGMAAVKRQRVQQLEHLIAREARVDRFRMPLRESAAGPTG